MAKRYKNIWALMVLAALGVQATALADLAEPEIGKAAPSFELPGIDGKTHKLEDYKGKILVITFENFQCPWANAYRPIFSQVAKKYARNGEDKPEVVVLGIDPTRGRTLQQIKERMENEKVSWVTLLDAEQKIADAYGARTTPHVYIIDPNGVLAYKGGIEKAPLSVPGVGKSDEQYLEPVLLAVLRGETPPVTETKAIGCAISRRASRG